MKLGLPQLKKFAENHDDHRVRALYARFEGARRCAAKWCDRASKLEAQNERLREELESWRLDLYQGEMEE